MLQNNDSSLYSSQLPSRNEQEKYKKIKVLGQGSMGKVYLVQCPQQQNKLYVMKRINIGHLNEKEKQQALSQAQLHSMVKHQNIIQFKEIYHTTKDKLCIIMEYADGGDLDQMLDDLKENKKFITEEEIMKYFVQICLALKQIHQKKIVHRDLKGANIFLAKDGKIKIGDFGISKTLDKTVLASKSFVGTPFYLSPQMVEGKPYSTKADIWALGVILYHMTALKLPFDANSLPVLALKILKGSFPQIQGNQYSKQLKQLISSMLQVDQRKRPSIVDILNKPILAKYLSKQTLLTIVSPSTKVKPKVELKVQKIKLATTKSKKQLSKQLTKQEKERKREEEKGRRQAERKKMIQDIKAKRLNSTKEQLQGDSGGNGEIAKNLQINGNSTTATADISSKKQQLAVKYLSNSPIASTISKQKLSSQQTVKSSNSQKHTQSISANEPQQKLIEKPWKNKNLLKQKKQPYLQIRLPGERKSLQQIKEQEPQQKNSKFEVQIFVHGQNPYRTNNPSESLQSRYNSRKQKLQEMKQMNKNYQNVKEKQVYGVKSNVMSPHDNTSNLISQNYGSTNNDEQIQQSIQQSVEYSYKQSNLQDLLANVQKAQNIVNNLSNPYQKNNIQLYEESEDFDNLDNAYFSNKTSKHGLQVQNIQSKPLSKKFQNNQSDMENMKFITNISDGQSLQELRSILEDRLGEQGFIKAHNIIKEHFEGQKHRDDQQASAGDREQVQSYLFNRKLLRQKLSFLSQQQFDRNIQLLYTISVMEDLQMMKNFDSSSSQEEGYYDDNQYQDESS